MHNPQISLVNKALGEAYQQEKISELGKKVFDLRKANKMTQEDLADLCGWDPRAIRRLESGTGNPTYRSLLILAEAFNVSVSDLV